MKAIVHEVYGSPDVLELKDIEKPPIKDNEVLLRVRAAAVNPPDWAGVTGVPYIVRAALNGARGGIGTFAVQIAKSFGAEVTGVCSTTKVDLVRSIGADHVIDYTQEDFTGGDEHYDVILDNVLNHSLSLLVSMLSPKGTLVPNGGQFHKRWIGGTGVMFIKAPLKSLFVPQRIRSVNEAPSQDELLALKELLESGKVTPVIGRTFPLSQTSEAIGYFGEGHARGKVVISM